MIDKKVKDDEVANERDEATEEGVREVEAEASGIEAQVAELVGDLQRTRADFENFRKQVEIQKENEKRIAKFATVCKVLPLLDDIDRAVENYVELKPLEKTLTKTLKELGLTKIDSSAGVEFNPDIHEAVMAEGDGDREVVEETLRPGYYYEGEVLREAMVKVKRVS